MESILSDIRWETFNLLQICQCNPSTLIHELSKLAYQEATFLHYKSLTCNNILESAIKEFVVRRMSRGSTGRSFSTSNRLRGGRPGSENSWLTAITNISAVSSALQPARIMNCSYEKTSQYDSVDTLYYLDPPYLHSTRTSKKIYEYEMTDNDHINLLNWAKTLKGSVVISGYNSDLYNTVLTGWNKYEKSIANSASQSKKKNKMVECIWKNY